MKLLLTSLFCILMLCTSSAQLNSSNEQVIKNQLLLRINQLRKEVGVPPLKLAAALAKPATVHSNYMSKSNQLTHGHSNPKFNNPKKRVEHFSPLIFDGVGENALITKRIKLPLSKQSSIQLADAMFKQWKNSPGHYENMIEREYDTANFGFALNRSNQIYATNVLAKRGIKIEGQLSNNQFGLQADLNDDCGNIRNFHSNILVNIGNGISLVDDEIILYYHDKKGFSRMFSGPFDGMAVDVLTPDQFSCHQVNQLDVSQVHDGILLKPTYSAEILSNNIAQSDYRIVSKIGSLPDEFKEKNVFIGILLIKNGVVCEYAIPSEVPSKRYRLKELKIHVSNPTGVEMKKNSILSSRVLHFPFNASETTPIEFPKLTIDEKNVVLIEIKSFSSIEGAEASNVALHTERARVIKQYLTKSLNIAPKFVKVRTKENWVEFYFQLKYYMADSLLDRSKNELRKLASTKTIAALPWDTMLFDQRKSSAIIYFEDGSTANTSSDKVSISNLKLGIVNQDFELANKALHEIYIDSNSIPKEIFDESIFETLLSEPSLVENASAVFLKYHYVNSALCTKFLNKWLIASELLTPEALENIVNLYTKVNRQLLSVWDLPSQRLSNVLKPTYVDRLSNLTYSNDLMLNLHLTFIEYYGQTNNRIKLAESFDFISAYFSSRTADVDDYTALGLFYNSWSRYDLTNQLLASKFEEIKSNEEAVYLLLHTLAQYELKNNVVDYEKVHQQGILLDKERWCSWMKSEILYLSDPNLKKLFCRECSWSE